MVTGARYLENAFSLFHGPTAFYGWKVLAVGVIGMSLSSGLSMAAFGLYVSPLQDHFGWSRAEVSLGFSASILGSGIASPLAGHWVDRRGPRSSILIGAVLTTLSFFLLASTQALWQFYLFYGIHAVCRQMMFFLPFQALISRWFLRRRAVALSILGTGFSLGGFLVLPIVAAVMGSVGWRGSYVFSGLVIALIFAPLALFVLRDRPEDVGQVIDGQRDASAPVRSTAGDRKEQVGLTFREAARTPLLWVATLGFTLLFYGVIGWTAHQIPYFESKGMSTEGATLIVALSSGAGILSRLAMGVIGDRVSRFEMVAVVLLGFLAVSMFALLLGTSVFAVGAFFVCWVIGTSAAPMVETLVLTRAFGLRFFGSILGTVLVFETIGEIASPSLAGEIFDRTGSYDGAVLMFAVVFTAGAVLFALASRMKVQAAAT